MFPAKSKAFTLLIKWPSWQGHSFVRIIYILYARHYNPLLIRNHSWLLTMRKTRILRKKSPKKRFLDFKKWLKSIKTMCYNGPHTVSNLSSYLSKWANFHNKYEPNFRTLFSIKLYWNVFSVLAFTSLQYLHHYNPQFTYSTHFFKTICLFSRTVFLKTMSGLIWLVFKNSL